jgi:hypothetical protein
MKMNMFEINKQYKIETVEGLFFTATILDENETHVKFETIRNEKITWLKIDIKRATKMERNEGEF